MSFTQSASKEFEINYSSGSLSSERSIKSQCVTSSESWTVEANEEKEIFTEIYFLPSEVVIHNKPNDCWVSYNDGVYDLTELCKKWEGRKEIEPILAYAGKDISHWFDHESNDIKHYIDPTTGARVPYCPHGRIPDVLSLDNAENINSRPVDKCPWWLDKKYKKGKLTKNPRPCKIVNTLAGTVVEIMVCEEDTIRRIQERSLKFNANAMQYTWKFEGRSLDLDSTLTQNGILDERDRFTACGLPEDYYVPSLMSYYNDKNQ